MYFLIGIWGGARRMYAAIKFFLYTMAGSILMLLAILWLGIYQGTFYVPDLLVSAPQHPGKYPGVAVPGICCRLCHQSSGLAAALLVAGCSCRSSYSWFCYPGRHPAKNGHVWFSAF